MADKKFSQVYVENVLDPAYRNWKANFYVASLKVHKAHLCMLYETGIISKDKAKEIAGGIAYLEQEFSAPGHIPEGVEDLYFLFEKALGQQIGDENAAWLHTARSRNDMDTTIFRLVLREELAVLIERLQAFSKALLARCLQGENELTVLFTHGQPANPSTTAHYLSSFLMETIGDMKWIVQALADVNQSTMGACAITGSGFPVDRQYVSDLLGFENYIPNTYQAVSTSHWLVNAASTIRNLMIDIGRFAADLLHKASSEVGLYRFPDDLVQVSSIMPQKRNPVILEHIRIQAEMVAGACDAVAHSFLNVPYQDVNENADMIISKLIETIHESTSVIDLLQESVLKMKSDPARAREICRQFGVTTTELADSLVRIYGIGFRKAHHICAEYVASGYDIQTLRDSFFKETRQALDLSNSRIEEILDPGMFIQVRKTPGGPSHEGIKEVYARAEDMLGDMEKNIISVRSKWHRADNALEEAFKALIAG